MKKLNKYRWGVRSKTRMRGIHPDLRKVMDRFIQLTDQDATVLEGLRSVKRQTKLYRSGASKTMNSRHLTGHAVDVAPLVKGQVSWDWKHYHPMARVMKEAARQVDVKIEWGGDWSSFKDGPHWQLGWSRYPK